MFASPGLHSALRIACAALCVAAATGHAQVRKGVQAAAPIPAPANANSLGTPSPAGLTSGNAPTLQSRFPAGLPSNSANPAGLPDPTVPNVSVPGVAANSPVVDPGVAQPVTPGGGGTRTIVVAVPGPYTATQIAGSFIGADANRDGELTRAEATRLTIAPLSFEDMDANHDGILTRSEYEDAIR